MATKDERNQPPVDWQHEPQPYVRTDRYAIEAWRGGISLLIDPGTQGSKRLALVPRDVLRSEKEQTWVAQRMRRALHAAMGIALESVANDLARHAASTGRMTQLDVETLAHTMKRQADAYASLAAVDGFTEAYAARVKENF